ncbi:MAG TPA: PRC-barrel domain-containing protein [Pirellulales bacterium]|nr:PRC-barrel domain-containing protein [Pirellulales bacterium]
MSAARCALTIGLMFYFCARHTVVGSEPSKAPADSQKDSRAETQGAVGPVHSARAWLGRAVRSQDARQAGRVEDLALDLEDGYVAFVVVKPEGTGPDDPFRLGLPLELLRESDSGNALTAQASFKSIMRAPRLERPGWIETVTRLWAIDAYEAFQRESPWEARRQFELWSPESPYGRMFNPQRMRTVEGRIENVDYAPPMPGMPIGTQLTLKSADRTWRVQLGPLAYLSQQDVSFKKGDDVSVQGSEASLAERTVLIAANIQLGKRKLRLRDKNGTTVWKGWNEAAASRRFVRLTELIDMRINDPQGRKIGEIRDFAISDRKNRVAYAVVALDEGKKEKAEKNADRLYAIPLGAFVAPPDARAWELELPEGLIEDAPSFSSGKPWPESVGRGWVEYVHVRYGRAAVGGVRSEELAERQTAE